MFLAVGNSESGLLAYGNGRLHCLDESKVPTMGEMKSRSAQTLPTKVVAAATADFTESMLKVKSVGLPDSSSATLSVQPGANDRYGGHALPC